MRIYPVVNVSRVVQYREQVKGQKKEEGKLVEIEGVGKWEIEKILWKKEEDLEHAKEVLEEFEGRMNIEVRRQEKLDIVEEKDFRRGKLLGKYTAKILYGWDNGKFEEENLRKLERN